MANKMTNLKEIEVLTKVLEHLEVYEVVNQEEMEVEIYQVRLKTENLFGTGDFHATITRNKETGEMELVDYTAGEIIGECKFE